MTTTRLNVTTYALGFSGKKPHHSCIANFYNGFFRRAAFCLSFRDMEDATCTLGKVHLWKIFSKYMMFK
jgi:hypothetical protein